MRSTFPCVIALCLSGLLTACSEPAAESDAKAADASPAPAESDALKPPQESGVLRVATRSGSTTYYLDRQETPTGPEYDLAEAFAKSHGWTVDWVVLPSTAAVLDRLRAGDVHLAAAGLTHLASRDADFLRGGTHTQITEQLVCNRNQRPLPKKPADIGDLTIRVTAHSSYVETLQSLAADNPNIQFKEDPERSTERLLTQVEQGELDCTVADSNIVQVNRRFMPHLDVAMDLTDTHGLGWYLPKDEKQLAKETSQWLSGDDGRLAVAGVDYRYYAYIGDFDFVDSRALTRRIDDRLPKYRDLFVDAEAQTGLPADLLAAQAYQESHWDPLAKSPTGVRGLMMLTLNTAKAWGVEDRLDPEQSVDGGARYLADRHRRLPETIPEPDRTFLALASYNVGRGHLLDARTLARKLGKNPDSWADMREVLPLLADKEYYTQLRYGYARGYEPVNYVSRIRNYRDVIDTAFR
ncbi:membrane-bound lytic murein transglycosylase MltF [Marinobacter sp. R17]|uniref:membrane-bound lytic murein transglycosylase MltF n=1 Tax=Marinobacter sp. R17 TaxID=2484250 RepID=UPI000F4D2426|nr:membrane-bound lytic murein transglycosylase MltF [Marinobacter sp. R17]ROT96385.1 membrane-bound lytic murein transglycosylase MltF [Marinobacter sp. R17]